MGKASSKQLNKRVAAVVLILLAAIAALAVAFRPKPVFYAPSRVESPLVDSDFGYGAELINCPPSETPMPPLGREWPIAEAIYAWPPDRELPRVAIKRKEEIARVEYEDKDSVNFDTELIPSPYFAGIAATRAGSVELPAGASLHLAGFGVRVPDVDENRARQWRFRRYNGEIASSEEWNAPPEFYETTGFENLERPGLRMVFRFDKLPVFRATHWAVRDANTGRVVGEVTRQTSTGDWRLVDFELGIWHNAPLEIELDLITGAMQEAELKLETNSQIQFGDRFRIGFALVALDDLRGFGGFVIAQARAPARKLQGSQVVFFHSESPYVEHCFPLPPKSTPDGTVEPLVYWMPDPFAPMPPTAVAYFPDRDIQEGDTLRLGFFPYRTRVWFQVQPQDLPNSADIEDLFDVRIPVVKLDIMRPADPFADLDRVTIDQIVGEATEFDINSFWGLIGQDNLHSNLVFYDTTPRELLELCLAHAHKHRVEVDSENRRLVIEPEPTWRERFEKWWAPTKANGFP